MDFVSADRSGDQEHTQELKNYNQNLLLLDLKEFFDSNLFFLFLNPNAIYQQYQFYNLLFEAFLVKFL